MRGWVGGGGVLGRGRIQKNLRRCVNRTLVFFVFFSSSRHSDMVESQV